MDHCLRTSVAVHFIRSRSLFDKTRLVPSPQSSIPTRASAQKTEPRMGHVTRSRIGSENIPSHFPSDFGRARPSSDGEPFERRSTMGQNRCRNRRVTPYDSHELREAAISVVDTRNTSYFGNHHGAKLAKYLDRLCWPLYGRHYVQD